MTTTRQYLTGTTVVQAPWTSRADPRTDLALLGMRFLATADRCKHPTCEALDTEHDVDLIAELRINRHPRFIAYRTSNYTFKTITVRAQTEKGNTDTQLAKLLEQRSAATHYVQSYEGWVVYTSTDRLREDLLIYPDLAPCSAHDRIVHCEDGQIAAAVCARCSVTGGIVVRDRL